MDSFDSVAPLWDFSQAPTSFSQLGDDDFLALLQKQFNPDIGTTALNSLGSLHDGVDPSKLSNLPPPAPPPPLSDDSSPSPPSMHSVNDSISSCRQSGTYAAGDGDSDDHALKRKASDEDLEEGPSHKTQHTGQSSSNLISVLSS